MSPVGKGADADKGPSSAPLSAPGSTPRSSDRAAPDRGPISSHRAPVAAEPELLGSLGGFALEVYRELSQHLSPPNCRALIAACAAMAGVAQSALGPDHLPMIAAQVDRTFAVFGVPPDVKVRCIVNLRAAARRAEHRNETLILVTRESDVVTARNAGKDICRELGFGEVSYVKAVTAISELARNILKYAGKGQIALRRLSGERDGIEIIATDQGPGIADVELVLSPRYRSKSGMGVGLRGTRWLMDYFEINSTVGSGTTVIFRKYKD
jgi:serine/threonine-protein kinase RsbT